MESDAAVFRALVTNRTWRRSTYRKMVPASVGGDDGEAQRPREGSSVPAKAAVRYLRGLTRTWRLAKGGRGREMLVRALFGAIAGGGFRELVLRLTPRAIAHGFQEVIPDRLDLTVG